MPDTSRSCTRRERSNTPLQALQLLNDPVFLEAAQALASRICREAPHDDLSRLGHAFQLVLARPIRSVESERLLAYLSLQRELLADEPEGAHELREHLQYGTDVAWVGLASVLLNLDEFITRE